MILFVSLPKGFFVLFCVYFDLWYEIWNVSTNNRWNTRATVANMIMASFFVVVGHSNSFCNVDLRLVEYIESECNKSHSH